jgi:SOS-response transcriptional repressor LexA
MSNSVIYFPRNEGEYRWYEILDGSLIASQIVCGDVIECHLENPLFSNALYVLTIGGHLIVRYLYLYKDKVTLIPACRDLPLIFIPVSEITIVGRVVRCCHDGRWRALRSAPLDDFWLRWAIEEAS